MNNKEYRLFFESYFTWIDGFLRNVRRYGDRLALISPADNSVWTYSELNREVNRLSNTLVSDGFHKGDVIMLLLSNCPEFAFSYVAAHKIHGVCCPVNYRLSAGELAHYFEDSRPMALIFNDIYRETVNAAIRMSGFRPERLISVDGETKDGIISYCNYVGQSPVSEPPSVCEYNMYDETTRIYTSGTTGRPKGVPLTSSNELLAAHDQMISLSLSHRDIVMNTTPWFHRGGMHSTGPCPAFYAGAAIVVLEKFEPETALEYVEKYKVTFFIGVPTVFDLMSDMQIQKGYDLSSLRGISSMGSPLDRSSCERYQKVLTPNIYNAYGISEMHAVSILQPSDLPQYAGTAGCAIGDAEVRIVKFYEERRAEPDDIIIDDNVEVGEVIVRSPTYSPYRYFHNEEETDKHFYKGYFYTNDLATWDKDKHITLVGRKDDLIISSGENIYPVEVEEVLNSHPKVKDSIITSVPDKIRGEMVTAYVIREDETVTAEELDEFCKKNLCLANFKRPRYYCFVNKFPLTSLGKKQYKKMKETALSDLIDGVLQQV